MCALPSVDSYRSYLFKMTYTRLGGRIWVTVLWMKYFFFFIFSAFCLRLTELRIEEHTLVGNSTRLECKYDLQGEKLYTVKWYKDGNEFYRFLPGESPEVQIFKVPGVHVDVSTILCHYSIIIYNMLLWIQTREIVIIIDQC